MHIKLTDFGTSKVIGTEKNGIYYIDSSNITYK